MAKTHKRTFKIFLLKGLPMQWYAFILFIAVVSFILLYQDYSQNDEIDIKRALLRWTTPVVEFLSAPVQGIKYSIDWASSLVELKEQHDILQKEASELRKTNNELAYIQKENEALRKLLNINQDTTDDFITARIISDSSGIFHRTILLNAGTARNIKEGMPVVADDGVVGRIIEVGYNYSRVLLLTDWTSRIPAIVEDVGVQAIVAGQNTSHPLLIHLSDKIGGEHQNKRILTSGRGGLFPPGLAIGTLQITFNESADASYHYQVIPYSDTDEKIFLQIYTGIPPLVEIAE